MVSQEELLAADQANPLLEAIACTEPPPPVAAIFAVEALRVSEPKALLVTAIDDVSPRLCKFAALKVAVFEALSARVRLMA
jgi:hypothetical protein